MLSYVCQLFENQGRSSSIRSIYETKSVTLNFKNKVLEDFRENVLIYKFS